VFGPRLTGYQPGVAYTKLVVDHMVLCFDVDGKLLGHNYLCDVVAYTSDCKAVDHAKVCIELDLSSMF